MAWSSHHNRGRLQAAAVCSIGEISTAIHAANDVSGHIAASRERQSIMARPGICRTWTDSSGWGVGLGIRAVRAFRAFGIIDKALAASWG
jgi:hypothetical protein